MGLGSDATGDIYYNNGGILTRLPKGSNGQALELVSGLPAWATLSGTGTVTSAQISQGAGITVTTTSGANPCVTTCNLTVAQSLTNATLQASPTNPTGISTSSAMMGLGTTCHITPVYSTRVRFEIVMNVSDTAIATPSVLLKFGTGTAPANGAAVSGTSIGTSKSATISTASGNEVATVAGIQTGLTVGTAVWFDVALTAGGAGASTITNADCNAFEF